MRKVAFLTVAAAMMLGLGSAQPAAAFDDSHGRGDIYIHHHVYHAPRVRNVYHIHKVGPRHVHVVHYAGNPYVWQYARRGYFAHPYAYHWRGYRR